MAVQSQLNRFTALFVGERVGNVTVANSQTVNYAAAVTKCCKLVPAHKSAVVVTIYMHNMHVNCDKNC